MITETNSNKNLLDHLAIMDDPRLSRNRLHPLVEVMFLLVMATLCGADSLRSYVDFGNTRLPWLRKYLPYANGIPSKSTLQRVLEAVQPLAFKECFLNWVEAIATELKGVIAIDGKTLRGSIERASGRSPLHIVSAFATSTNLVLGQERVSGKSNEITAIPKLLSMLELKGCIVTIDAMGCQKKIAKQIVDSGGDYLFGLKGNQGNIHKEVQIFFERKLDESETYNIQMHEHIDKGHGRLEIRRCYCSDNLSEILFSDEWEGLNTVVMVESTRNLNGKESIEKRYYLSSAENNPEQMQQAVRSHWGIENTLHWSLDVSFKEDLCSTRNENAAENLSLVRKLAMNIVQKAKNAFKGLGIKRLIKKAGWCTDTLDQVLFHGF